MQKPELHEVVELCGEVVGVATPAPEANFFEIGGDSLTALRVVILAEERWDISLDVAAVTSAPTLRDLHDELLAAAR